jgi:hypothetical protein
MLLRSAREGAESMIKRTVKRFLWLGRATSTVVGLAILFALAIGAANSALAHTNVDNKLFHLDHNNNVATALTKLTGTLSGAVFKLDNNGTGPALFLEANTGRAPLVVNAGAGKATNLNADKLDDREASSFADGVNGKATDSELLDGQDSSAFQQRVSGVCPEGSSIRSIGADGTTLDCEQDDEGDGGAAQVNNLRTELGTNDGVSNEADDPVSFSQVKNIDSNILSRNADQLDGLDSALYQRRVSAPCPPNFYMRAIDPNGTPICGPDDAPALRAELGSNTDTTPNQPSDPVSFGRIKGIPSDIVQRNAESLDGMDSISFQRRVASACPTGSSIRAIDVDGTPTCETDDDGADALRSELGNANNTDTAPNQPNDPVSFNKVKDIPADVVDRDADTLDNLDSTQFVQGQGRIVHQARSVDANTGVATFHTELFGLQVGCPADPTTTNGNVAFFNNTSSSVDLFSDNGGSDPVYQSLAPAGQTGQYYNQEISRSGEMITFQLHTPSGKFATVWFSSVNRGTDCWVQTQALIGD